MKKEKQSVSNNCCDGTSASCQQTYAIKTKTRTLDIYKITKKGKEKLVARNVTTITKTTYPDGYNIYVNSPYNSGSTIINPNNTTSYHSGFATPFSNDCCTSCECDKK